MDWSIVIGGVLGLIGSLVGTYMANSKAAALQAYRLQQLEDKVSKHNNLVERMALVERDIKTICKEIDEIKKEEHQ